MGRRNQGLHLTDPPIHPCRFIVLCLGYRQRQLLDTIRLDDVQDLSDGRFPDPVQLL